MNKKYYTKEKFQNSEKFEKKPDLSKQEIINALYELYITAKDHKRKKNLPSKK
jgi:hypothetical protein